MAALVLSDYGFEYYYRADDVQQGMEVTVFTTDDDYSLEDDVYLDGSGFDFALSIFFYRRMIWASLLMEKESILALSRLLQRQLTPCWLTGLVNTFHSQMFHRHSLLR